MKARDETKEEGRKRKSEARDGRKMEGGEREKV